VIPLQFKVFEAPDVPTGVKVSNAADVVAFMGTWARAGREVFNVVYLTAKNTVIHVEPHSAGGVDSSGVYPAEVFKLGLALNASSVILVHNHPSGDPSPSLADKDVTASMAIVGRLLGIKVLDHVIIGAGRHYSFADDGRLLEAERQADALVHAAVAVHDSVPAGCPGCGWWAGELEFSRFHCWRRSKSRAPESAEGCSEFWPAGSPRPAADPVGPDEGEPAELVDLPADPGQAASQLSLFGGEK